jgi:hypothetical protein
MTSKILKGRYAFKILGKEGKLQRKILNIWLQLWENDPLQVAKNVETFEFLDQMHFHWACSHLKTKNTNCIWVMELPPNNHLIPKAPIFI